MGDVKAEGGGGAPGGQLNLKIRSQDGACVMAMACVEAHSTRGAHKSAL